MIDEEEITPATLECDARGGCVSTVTTAVASHDVSASPYVRAPPSTSITESFASSPTIDEAIRICDSAWECACKMRESRGISRPNTMSDEMRERIERNIYETLLDQFRDLCTTYPAIVAAMVVGRYNQRAARKFFAYVREHPWKGEDEFFDVQSAYSAMLMRALSRQGGSGRGRSSGHRHVGTSDIARVRAQTRQELKNAETKMREDIERATKAATEINARRARARLADLKSRIQRDAPLLLDGVSRSIVVSFDDDQ